MGWELTIHGDGGKPPQPLGPREQVDAIVNTSLPIMFAHGEQVILPALLLIAALVLFVYPGALWVLANSRDRTHRRSVVWCAAVLTLLCGAGVVMTLKDFTWPPELGDCIDLLIWAVPATCGAIALTKAAKSAKHERNLNN